MKPIETHLKTSAAARLHGKRLALMAGCLCSCSTLALADYASEVLSENPLAYYRFNDAVAVDDLDTAIAVNLGSLGTAGNGAFGGTNTRGLEGAVAGNSCIAFSNPALNATGYVGSVSVGNNAALNPSHTGVNPFSVELWVKPNTITSTLLSPISSMSFATGRAGYLIYQNADKWQLRVGNKAAANNVTAADAAAGSVKAGQWQHLVACYTGGANGTMTLFVDGTKVIDAPVTNGYEANDNAPLLIGATANIARTFDGAVDEVAVYSSVLSDTRIAERIAERTSNPAGYEAHVLADAPIGYWRLNEAPFVPRTPPVALNQGSLGAAANGGYYAGSKNTSTGPDSSGGYLGFEPGNSALGLATANGHVGTAIGMLYNRTEFTVSGWVKRGANKSTRGGYFGQNDLLEFGDNATNIESWISARGGNILKPYSFADDTWGFICLTADANRSILFLNGVEVGRLEGTVANYGGTPVAPAIAYNFNIGGGGIFNVSGDYFLGEIDEVAVFDKALTPGRVQQLYDAALGNVAPTVGIPTVSPSAFIPEGQSYTLTADPAGTPPFSYKWYRDGVLIPNANGKTYTVTNAATQTPVTSPFIYSVEVTNGTTTVPSGELEVFVSAGLVWTGANPTNPSFWDIDTTANWKTISGSVGSKYTDDFAVFFDDTAVATAVEFQQDVAPRGVVFSNNAPKTFTLTGIYGLIGVDGLIKNGSGTVELFGDQFYTGPTVINGGILKVGDGTAGTLSNGSEITVNGGALHLNGLVGASFTNTLVLGAGGQLAITGTGDYTLSGGAISGAGSELFDRNGMVFVNRSNVIGNVTISSGEVVFSGSQEANRLANGALVTVNSGATMTVRGVNALPTAERSVHPTLNQATLKLTSSGGSHNHFGDIVLNGSSIILDNSGGNAYDGESFQLNGALSVTGTNHRLLPSARVEMPEIQVWHLKESRFSR